MERRTRSAFAHPRLRDVKGAERPCPMAGETPAVVGEQPPDDRSAAAAPAHHRQAEQPGAHQPERAGHRHGLRSARPVDDVGGVDAAAADGREQAGVGQGLQVGEGVGIRNGLGDVGIGRELGQRRTPSGHPDRDCTDPLLAAASASCACSVSAKLRGSASTASRRCGRGHRDLGTFAGRGAGALARRRTGTRRPRADDSYAKLTPVQPRSREARPRRLPSHSPADCQGTKSSTRSGRECLTPPKRTSSARAIRPPAAETPPSVW